MDFIYIWDLSWISYIYMGSIMDFIHIYIYGIYHGFHIYIWDLSWISWYHGELDFHEIRTGYPIHYLAEENETRVFDADQV